MKRKTIMLMLAITLAVGANAHGVVPVDKVVATSKPLSESSAANQWLVGAADRAARIVAGSIQYAWDSFFRW